MIRGKGGTYRGVLPMHKCRVGTGGNMFVVVALVSGLVFLRALRSPS